MIGRDLERAARLLREGALVAIPTETVYGLAGNAFSETAVAEIFAVKQRPAFDPLIVHAGSLDRLQTLAADFPPEARRLAEAFMPGPLTLLLPKSDLIPDLVTAGSPNVALRIPNHPMTLNLLNLLEFPLAAPSANPFGYISPTTAQHVGQQLGSKIPYILDGGPCRVGLESTIVGFNGPQAVIYRKGGIPVEAIEEIAGPVLVMAHSSSDPMAPGMLKSHYAPKVPLRLGNLDEMIRENRHLRLGILSFQRVFPRLPRDCQVVLSENGDFTEAARRLFAGMRYLDELPIDLILAEPLPEEHLGRAINDRLRRAAAGS
ncbi:MAG: threonylcarbamoyl-AMP synthase [Haliscomenobacter sp.]|nr:threonylcarbamoyl-AMP synthase [Haliscomenobacter sp.]MBK7475666.1 threonylcarbamoyl-AMP synthase [Haliscomenobacter sp.]